MTERNSFSNPSSLRAESPATWYSGTAVTLTTTPQVIIAANTGRRMGCWLKTTETSTANYLLAGDNTLTCLYPLSPFSSTSQNNTPSTLAFFPGTGQLMAKTAAGSSNLWVAFEY